MSSMSGRSIRLSKSGMEVCDLVTELYDEQLAALMETGLLGDEDLKLMRNSLRNLERFWADQIGFSAM
jgi:hypothetical protein